MRTGKDLDSKRERLLKKAQRAIKTAYKIWKQRLQRENPASHRLLSGCYDPEAASLALQDRPGALRGLMRATDAAIVRAGKTVITMARSQLLHRLLPKLQGDVRERCREWAAAIHATAELDTRWHLVQDSNYWKRLQAAAAKAKISIPYRTQPGLTDVDWCRLVAITLLAPGCTPHAFSTRELPQQCDALMMWMSDPTNTVATAAAGSAVARRDREKAREVFQHWTEDPEEDEQSHPMQDEIATPRY